MSSARDTTFLTLVPSPTSSISYWVTEGPRVNPLTRASTPNRRRVCSRAAMVSRSVRPAAAAAGAFRRRSNGGRRYPPFPPEGRTTRLMGSSSSSPGSVGMPPVRSRSSGSGSSSFFRRRWRRGFGSGSSTSSSASGRRNPSHTRDRGVAVNTKMTRTNNATHTPAAPYGEMSRDGGHPETAQQHEDQADEHPPAVVLGRAPDQHQPPPQGQHREGVAQEPEGSPDRERQDPAERSGGIQPHGQPGEQGQHHQADADYVGGLRGQVPDHPPPGRGHPPRAGLPLPLLRPLALGGRHQTSMMTG